jgi:hypothetical protein
MRTSLRSASKVQERGLQALADRLAGEPALALPVCVGHASHFKRAQKAVMKAWEARDDPAKLAKLARGGPPLGRAYAATLLMGQTDEQVIMLQVNTPFGKVPVASRGKAKAIHLVGMQHLDDRKLRLMMVIDLVTRKRLAFYSMPGGSLICGGKSAAPPAEFVQAEVQGLGLIKDPEGWGCAHAIHAPERLTLRWAPAGTSLRKCGACAREGNMLHTIVQHMAAPRVLEGFEVQVELAPLPAQGSQAVELPTSPPLDPAALERYRKGELDDAGLIAAQKATRLAQLRTLPGPLYVNNGVSFGADLDAFLTSLGPTPLEATALRGALQGHTKAVVQERGSPSKVLTELWPERGRPALEAVASSAAIAEQIFAAHDVGAKGVGPALQQAQARGLREQTDSSLPSYRDLPPAARLADKVARAHRAHGRGAAIAALEQSDDARVKAVVHAFELALGAGQGKEWKYSPTEQDLAHTLQGHAAALLAAEPARYHEHLAALARAAGVSEELRRA